MKKKYNDGGIYEGEGTLLTKKRHGRGKMIYANGEIYEGEWKDDKRCGKGELYHQSLYSKSYSYTGEWVDDKLNGQGTFTDGYITYKGEFIGGKYNGKGTLVKKRYNTVATYTYSGDFAGGKKHGQGFEECQEYTYYGAFARDMHHGKGKKTFPNKDYCDGNFVNGTFSEGKIRKTESTGDVYEGSCKNNLYEGHGKLTMTDGTVYTGNFKSGQLNGIITITKPDGTKVKEKYENGVSLEAKSEAVEATAVEQAKVEAAAVEQATAAPSKSQALVAQEEAQRSAQLAYSIKDKIKARTKDARAKIDGMPVERSFFYESLNAYGRYRGEKNSQGKPHGYGIYQFPLSGSYEGDFNNGYFCGLGIHEADKAQYYGEFASYIHNNLPAIFMKGKGVYTIEGGYEYAGDFDAMHHGYGVLRYPNGDIFEGKLFYGKKYSHGVLTYANGDKYEGEFSNDEPSGKGKLTKADGSVYEGKFKNSLLDGVITVTKPDGTKVKEKYKNGEPLDSADKAKSTTTKSSAKKSATTKKGAEAKTSAVTKKEPAPKSEPKQKESTPVKATSKKTGEKKAPSLVKKERPMPNGAEYKAISEACQIAAKKARDAEKEATKAAADSVSAMNRNTFSCSLKDEIKLKNLEGLGDDKYKGGTSSENVLHGYGEYLWADGQKYCGEWKNDKRTGLGVYFYPNNNRYEGQLFDSKHHGYGVFYLENESKYLGELQENNFHGYGVFRWLSGDRYEGQWKNNSRTGKGVYYYNDGNIYEGDFVDGGRSGKGVFLFKSGDRYEGDFANDTFDGIGTYYFSGGDVYKGDWNNGARTGKGVYYFDDGSIYEGVFLSGKFHGKGTFNNANGDLYVGEWKNGYREGKGVYTFANGDRDEGTFKNGKLNGYGKRIWANGDVYEGNWKDDVRTGKGVFTFANGDKYEGKFLNGAFHGSGTFTYADGRQEIGTFENGSLVPPVDDTPKNGPVNVSAQKADEKGAENETKKQSTGITFADVAGLNDVKEQIIINVLEPMKDPAFAAAFDVKPGGKILLYGPPGTGKTFIARAIAGEIDAAFYPVNCQDLNSKWVGEGTEMLNNLFKEARKNERAIIFFDEFDSMAYKRDTGNSSAGVEMARFVATLLTNVDGFQTEEEGKMLLLIAATNRPWAIDSAMLRGGRFDTQIYVGVPDQEAREFLINKALGKLSLEEDVSLKDLAADLEGYGGGDIVAICDKIRLGAYKKSLKSGKIEKITKEDCVAAKGSVKNNITPEEIARFEAYKNGQVLS